MSTETIPVIGGPLDGTFANNVGPVLRVPRRDDTNRYALPNTGAPQPVQGYHIYRLRDRNGGLAYIYESIGEME